MLTVLGRALQWQGARSPYEDDTGRAAASCTLFAPGVEMTSAGHRDSVGFGVMATDAELGQALGAVQQVLASPAFIALAADPEALKACFDDPAGALHARGIDLPAAVRRVEMKVRHTPPLARQRGLRGGNFEWRFAVQVGDRSWRVVYLCDAWPVDATETEADTADG